MIQWMHALSKHWLATLLMGGFTLAFVVWGMGLDQFNIGSSGTVATVGGTEIDQTEFQRTYRSFIKSEGERMGGALTPDMAQKLGLDRVVLQQIEIRTAIDNEARSLGLTVSDAQVAQQVRDIPAFKGVLGTFDRAVFRQRIADAGFNTEDEFLGEIRKDMTREQLTQAVEGNFAVPSTYAQAVFLFINERRAADYVIVSPDNAGPVAPPSDAVLAAYVKANPERFSTPQYRSADFAYITTADANATVTDAQIKAVFDLNKSTYVAAEKRDVQQILFKTEADAKAARARIAGGAPFESVGKPASLGTLEATQIPDPATSKAVFALALNDVSQPLSNGFGGWTLDRVTKIVPGSNKTLDDVKEDIRKDLQPQVAKQKLDDIANAFTDARSNGLDLAQAAKKAGMKTGHVDAVDATGLKPDGTKADIPADPEFLEGLFKAETGEDGDPFAAKSGAYYVVKVNGETPPKLKSLDQVRAAATQAWTQEQKNKQAAQRTGQLVAQAEKEKSLDGVAKALNVSVQHSPALNRQTNDTMFSSTVVQRLFDAPPGGVVSGPQGASGAFIIARVTGIVHPRLNSNDRGFIGGAAELSSRIAGDFTNALANAARTRQGVKVNQKVLAQLVGTGGQ
jgi:peptidyl-prolyl cis-trans isomerase D